LPVPIETPVYVLDESASDESLVELEEEEEETADEFPGIIKNLVY